MFPHIKLLAMAKNVKSSWLDNVLSNAGVVEMAVANVDSYGITFTDGSKISFRELKEKRELLEDYTREGVAYLKGKFSSPSQNGWRNVLK